MQIKKLLTLISLWSGLWFYNCIYAAIESPNPYAQQYQNLLMQAQSQAQQQAQAKQQQLQLQLQADLKSQNVPSTGMLQPNDSNKLSSRSSESASSPNNPANNQISNSNPYINTNNPYANQPNPWAASPSITHSQPVAPNIYISPNTSGNSAANSKNIY